MLPCGNVAIVACFFRYVNPKKFVLGASGAKQVEAWAN